MPQPIYPGEKLKAVQAKGLVNVCVSVNKNGYVVNAVAISGHPLLRKPAQEAAMKAIFNRTLINGVPVKISGTIVYEFSPQLSQISTIATGGVANGKATYFPQPQYSPETLPPDAKGSVNVRIVIDEEGNTVYAEAVSGHPAIRKSAEDAARRAKFKPTYLSGVAVKVRTTLIYNFDPSKSCPANPPLSFGGGGVINGRATFLPKPEYPEEAKQYRASGAVNVQVLVEENGDVIAASAVSGHPLLRAAVEKVARQAKFKQVFIDCKPVKTSGTIVYNFVAP